MGATRFSSHLNHEGPFDKALAQLASITDLVSMEPEYYEILKSPRREVNYRSEDEMIQTLNEVVASSEKSMQAKGGLR